MRNFLAKKIFEKYREFNSMVHKDISLKDKINIHVNNGGIKVTLMAMSQCYLYYSITFFNMHYCYVQRQFLIQDDINTKNTII